VLKVFLTLVEKKLLTLVIFYLFINVKVALFAAFSISVVDIGIVNVVFFAFHVHECNNVELKVFYKTTTTKRNENFFDVCNKQMSIQD
jgi:hypothetical protein